MLAQMLESALRDPRRRGAGGYRCVARTAAGAVGMPRGIEQLRLVDPERKQHRIRSGVALAGVQRGLVANARTRRRSLAAPGYAERFLRGCGAAGSAPPWHGGGQGFESPQLHHALSGVLSANGPFVATDLTRRANVIVRTSLRNVHVINGVKQECRRVTPGAQHNKCPTRARKVRPACSSAFARITRRKPPADVPSSALMPVAAIATK